MVKSDVGGSVAGVASEVLNTGVLNTSASMNRLEEYGWNCAVSGDRVSSMLNRVWVDLWSRVMWVEEIWKRGRRRHLGY